MAKVGKLYILARDPGVTTYAMNDTWNLPHAKETEWVSANKFSIPFLLLSEHGREDNYWIQILMSDGKKGWIHIEEEQLRIIGNRG